MISALPRARALVTAAASAIGAIYAHRLAKRGYDLVLAAADTSDLERFAAWMASCTGCLIETVRSDPASEPDLGWLLSRLRCDGDLTMLVNIAATHADGGWLEQAASRSLIDYNFDGPALLAYAAGAAFAGRNRGAIINIGPPCSSLLADEEGDGRMFLKTLSQSLDSELRGCGVRAQAVLPVAGRRQFRRLVEEQTEHLARDAVLAAESMVDEALASFDNGEIVSRPTLPACDEPAAFRLWGSGPALRSHGAPPARA